jgi:hypothetical protein
MCAMSGKPRCDAAGLAIHTGGEKELFHAAGHLSDRVTWRGAAGGTLRAPPEPGAKETGQLAVYQPIRAILRSAASGGVGV